MDVPMTYEQRSRALREKATPGEWVVRNDVGLLSIDGETPDVCVVGTTTFDGVEADAAHIVFTHNTAEAVERLAKAVRDFRKNPSTEWSRLEMEAFHKMHNSLAALDSISEEGNRG